MQKDSVLVSGPTISKDKPLIASLREHVRVRRTTDNRQIEHILNRENIAAVILEISSENAGDLEVIKSTKAQHRDVKIILVDGYRDLVATAINYGVSDVFKKPYKGHLLVERVNALIKPP